MEFQTADAATKALGLNGNPVPNSSRQFKLNWASGGGLVDRRCVQSYSITFNRIPCGGGRCSRAVMQSRSMHSRPTLGLYRHLHLHFDLCCVTLGQAQNVPFATYIITFTGSTQSLNDANVP